MLMYQMLPNFISNAFSTSSNPVMVNPSCNIANNKSKTITDPKIK